MTDQAACQGADFSRPFAALAASLEAHAERDYSDNPVRRAVFLAHGGHAPGESCPTATVATPQHYYLCQYPDDECTCHQFGIHHDTPRVELRP